MTWLAAFRPGFDTKTTQHSEWFSCFAGETSDRHNGVPVPACLRNGPVLKGGRNVAETIICISHSQPSKGSYPRCSAFFLMPWQGNNY
jgi:hypothetical protein